MSFHHVCTRLPTTPPPPLWHCPFRTKQNNSMQGLAQGWSPRLESPNGGCALDLLTRKLLQALGSIVSSAR